MRAWLARLVCLLAGHRDVFYGSAIGFFGVERCARCGRRNPA